MADQFDDFTKLLQLAQVNRTKALLREAITKSGLKIIETEPLAGYYRCAAVKDGPLLPVAIWRGEGGQLFVLRSGEPVKLERVWPYCVWNPIPFEWYEAATERGEKWPDEAALAVNTAIALAEAATPPAQRTIGDNNPPVEDEATALKSQIEAAKGVAEQDYQDITTQEQADAAQSLRSRLLSLSGDADKRRETEKAPHWEKAKAVDAKWQPVVKLGKEAADWLRAKLSAYATKKANEEAEHNRQEIARQAAEADKARAEGRPEPEQPEQRETPPAAAAPVTIKGATGRAATVKAVQVAKVVDYDKAYQHLKSIPEIKKAIEQVAQRFITAGNEVPGVEVHEERRVA